MIIKWLTRLLFIIGILTICYSSFKIWHGEKQVSIALSEAIEIVSTERKAFQDEIIDTQADNSVNEYYEMDVEPLIEQEIDFNLNEILGVLRIPKLQKSLPVLFGTDKEQLKRGVGHYVGSKLPGEAGQIVLSGHRDTVFRSLGSLLIGDQVNIETIDGTFSYNIVHTYIVEADDRTVIDFSIDEEILLLTTCYPFSFVGDAPQRYIIEAKPISEQKE
ncbi:class D sortase [Desulfuribacillus alkaliarsenatis]|uniref:Class D sortase n=1 Tax=Desulfuribacillus alkaliarsenatis TaxID=766136 RepID=A0A1E5G4L7_9FIRM|nr:class D sortase [Desulfuribacillus alkaliarsenatis]OEF98132.1 hypothetical protein BHF68_00110 [Desulfuribacillus alkaliarsenatis]